MTMKTKAMVCLALASLSFCVVGGDYDGYYSMIRDSGSAWVNGWGWPNNTYPSAGAKCYIPPQYYMQVKPEDSATTFAGSELAIAGTFYLYAIGTSSAWNAEFRNSVPFIMAPGGVFKIASYSTHFYSPMEIRGTRENPALFQFYTADTNNRMFYPYFTFTSTADAVVRFCVVPDNVNGRFQYVFSESADSGADLSGYYGTLLFNDAGATFNAFSFSMPGTLELTNGAQAYLTGNSATSSFGTLKIDSGSGLSFTAANNTHDITITSRLVLADGSKLGLKKINSFAIPSNETSSYKVFTLTDAAVQNGIPDFQGVTFDVGYEEPIDSNRANSKKLGLPTVAIITNMLAGGAAEISIKPRPVVTFTSNNGWMQTPFAEGFDCTGYLSDNRSFHADADYFATGSYNIRVQGTGAATVFSGHSITFKGTGVTFYDDYEFPDLRICSGAVFRPGRDGTQWPVTLTVGGKAQVLENGWAAESWKWIVRNNNGWKIDSALSGYGSIQFEYSPANTDTKERWSGAVELCGDNSAFTGTMTVAYDPSGASVGIFNDKGWGEFSPGAASNTTLTVHNKSNLGGALAAFNSASLVIGDYCRLAFAETAVFDEMTRGWSFPANGFLRVPDGKRVTVKQTITCGDGARLVKEGAGTLILGGTVGSVANAAVAPTLEVAEGRLGFAASNAFGNLVVSFASDAKLVIDATTSDSELKAKGLAVSSATFGTSGDIPVVIDAGVMQREDTASVAVMTLADAASAEAMKTRLAIARIPEHKTVLSIVANGDGFVTIRADVKPVGFVLSVK